MITRDEIERLKNKPPPNPVAHLTPGGALHQHVAVQEETKRQHAIQYGEHVLRMNSEKFREDMALKARKGQARVQFNTQQQAPNLKDTDRSFNAGQVRKASTPTVERNNAESFRSAMKQKNLSRQYDQAR